MGKGSAIEWTDHTFNPWWGCVQVSEACRYCYAESLSTRYGHQVWGRSAKRRFFGDKHWNEPYAWDVEATKAKVRRRVFCASMADVFEFRRELDQWRNKLWDLVLATRGLDWLLLTKRPENIREMVPPSWLKDPPPNVWYGTTVERQAEAEERIPQLLEVPARVRFLSCEPLLGPVDLSKWIDVGHESGGPEGWIQEPSPIHWVIVGGESGSGARPMQPAWARSLRAQLHAARVPFFFKQWGTWGPSNEAGSGDELQCMGKSQAGRLLDGRTWDEFPTPAAPTGGAR